MSDMSPGEAEHLAALARMSRHENESVVAVVPSPEAVASYLVPELAAALAQARLVLPARIYRTNSPHVPALRRYGLCEINGNFLTAHGMQVRRAIIGDEN
jgi:hypothetical protein